MNDTQKTYELSQLKELLVDCAEYADREEDKPTADAYQTELKKLLLETLTQPDVVVWHHMIQSGLFHDAIGKVVQYDSESVTVALEY